MNAAEPRETCSSCRRPTKVCYCRHVTKIATRTRVVILQHPRERDVPINTGRIASLCLPDAELAVGVRWSGTDVLARALGDPSRPAALLYPGPGAIDVSETPPPGAITLVMVDGTWWQAKKVIRENPELAALPRYAFRPPRASEYRIRKEPHEDCVSTIEALVHVLGALEGGDFEAMLAPFRAMVEAQLAYAAAEPAPRHRRRERPRRDPRDRLPALLRDRAADLVCVHGEANAWPYGTRERAAGADDLVQWTAHRLSTGETFERFVAPRSPLAPRTAFHLGVDAARIERGASHGELFSSWRDFVRPTDVLCMWGTYAPGIFLRAGGTIGSAHVDVRRAARLFSLSKVGTMDAFLERIGVPSVRAPGASGRAATRLGQLVAIARWLTVARSCPTAP